MSYNTLKVNNKEPVDGNIEFDLTSCLSNTPQEANAIRLSSGDWVAEEPPQSGAQPQDLTFHLSDVPRGTSYGISLYTYSSTRWAYTWYKGGVTSNSAISTYINAVLGPGVVTNANFTMGFSLPAGKYLVRAIPAFHQGSGVCRLYTAANTAGTSGGTYHGNSVYINANDGKTGSTLNAVIECTSNRYLFIRVSSPAGSIALTTHREFQNHTIQIRKIV